jgi:hypothetical protein
MPDKTITETCLIRTSIPKSQNLRSTVTEKLPKYTETNKHKANEHGIYSTIRAIHKGIIPKKKICTTSSNFALVYVYIKWRKQ